jgi:hypothetical protein
MPGKSRSRVGVEGGAAGTPPRVGAMDTPAHSADSEDNDGGRLTRWRTMAKRAVEQVRSGRGGGGGGGPSTPF